MFGEGRFGFEGRDQREETSKEEFNGIRPFCGARIALGVGGEIYLANGVL